MNKTDFAELKEKLGKFDPKPIEDLCNDRWASYEMFEAYRIIAKESAKEQHAKSAAIISELIEIIKSQSEEIQHACYYLKDTGVEQIEDCEPDKQMYDGFVKSLSETTTRLQKLRDGQVKHEQDKTTNYLRN